MVVSSRARKLRFFAPAAVLLAIALIAFVPTLSSAATPDLPALSPEQLISKVQQNSVQAFSGTVRLTTNLGIPNLGAVQEAAGTQGGGFNPLDLLTGTHEATFKVDGPDRQAVSMTSALSETDAFHDGQNAWTWQSDGQKVTHYILPAHPAEQADAAPAPEPVPLPDQLAKEALDRITPSTVVSVATPAYVADQPVYELVLAPHAADSTVDRVGIAVDAAKGFPLQVTVWAKGQEKPALQLGFASIDYSRPSGPFTFTPPAGATVTNKDLTKHDHGGAQEPAVQPEQPDLHGPTATSPDAPPPQGTTVLGQDWTQVVVAHGVTLPGRTRELDRATTPVSGAFGTGRLLHTSLVNVLLLPDGRVAAGLVTPAALEAAVPSG